MKNKEYEHIQKLEAFVSSLGWFSKTLKLIITLENEFEGFYGKASETWETRIKIEIQSPDENICPNVSITGNRFDTIDDVAKAVLNYIENWKADNLMKFVISCKRDAENET